ncbi:hypothetical protein G7061_06865 [Erysipelothrix sp. HDW6B]|uniref:hypothetical protein n=1 Tax=Erysipelothrix sp. HDW6B TaxID=2714929 RepID=UPI00140C1130|nr:hypothetical protein [Erysipelothrix sp. HDW6B]QIK86346.1 hypothetical protein G7061_06865 [Erysipelothrix sp. HDW6B]
MENDLLVVYKFGSRFNGDLSPKEGINIYDLHAREHQGKVLFTINKAPDAKYRDRVKKIILMTKDGSFAIRADVDFAGKGNIINPPKEYSIPSIWDNEERTQMGWFALSKLERIVINRGDYLSVNGKDLIDSMSGNAYMSYVAI